MRLGCARNWSVASRWADRRRPPCGPSSTFVCRKAVIDERGFSVLRMIRASRPVAKRKSMAQAKEIMREQYLLVRLDEERAISAIPKLLGADVPERQAMLDVLHRVLAARGELPDEGAPPAGTRRSAVRCQACEARQGGGSQCLTPRFIGRDAMSDANIRPVLAGQKALVVGMANDQSIAYGCAKAFRTVGAEVAITWLNDRARPYVEPLARGSTRRSPERSTFGARPNGSVVRSYSFGMGKVRHPGALHRLCAERRPARRTAELFG